MNNRLIRPPSRHNVQRFFVLERNELNRSCKTSDDNYYFQAIP